MIKCHLSRLLGERKMHILKLKKSSGVSYTTLLNLYHEKTSRIDYNTIDQICRVLQCQVGDLFEYVETKDKGKEIKPRTIRMRSHKTAR
ncbi:helix-turn-helix transcriptional regulator [Desulfobacterota bacterium AH_259_B03_O07]|nr:helix-turn-helix transcriptional regulator [Desulfobacterota bacterium AH_259_B03_O07]